MTSAGLDWARDKWKGSFGSWYIHTGEKTGVRFAHEIVVLNHSTQKYFQDTYGRATHYIPNGVNPVAPAAPDIIREKYGLEKDSYILYLGRMVPKKGCHYLVDAFKKLHTDKKLVIAGGSSDTHWYIDQLKEQAGVDDRIIFTGFVDGALREELYSNAYLFVLPSDLEGMPLCLLEAMSYSNCVITSDIEECYNVIHDNGIYNLASEQGITDYQTHTLIYATITTIVLSIIIFLVFKGFQIKEPQSKEKEILPAFTQKQIITLVGFLAMIVASAFFKRNVGLISFAVAVVLLLLNTAC